jgi:hypothetical protein
MKAIIILIVLSVLLVVIYFLLKNKTEKFTNEAGYFSDTSQCSNLTLGNCLKTANCGWCYQDGFNSQCTPGDTHGPYNGQCKRWYQNDIFTRASLANDNDYKRYENEPIFDDVDN